MKRAIFLVIPLFFLLYACSSIKYVPTYQKDTVYVATHDQTVQKDSIFIFKDRITKAANTKIGNAYLLRKIRFRSGSIRLRY